MLILVNLSLEIEAGADGLIYVHLTGKFLST